MLCVSDTEEYMGQIEAYFEYITEFNILSTILRILLAALAGGIIGNERGRSGRPAGFRTHILVCLGGAMTALVSLYVYVMTGMGGDIFRIPASVVSGIGFLGAGIIMVRDSNNISGLTTAAGMWVTAIIGIAFGFGFYLGGILTTVICMINASWLMKIDHRRSREIYYYFEVKDVTMIEKVLEQVQTLLDNNVSFETIPAKSGLSGSVGFNITTANTGNQKEIKDALNRIEGVSFVVPGRYYLRHHH